MGKHPNNIGLLRLILAILVIVGHAPEIFDGDRHREPLTLLFHSLSLGEFAVDGFFLLSGYLIAKSMLSTGMLGPFLVKRAARIYPAFIVCYGLCVGLLAPLTGAHPWRQTAATLINLVTLKPPPPYPGELIGLHYPVLNGAMWTIEYEFRCYMLVALLWAVGLLRRRAWVLTLTLVATASAVASNTFGFPATFDRIVPHADWLLGTPQQNIRLAPIFLIGACTFLYWKEIYQYLNGRTAACASLALLFALVWRNGADIAVATLGGIVIFWLGLKANIGPLQKINDRWDISYGVYLYGWPISTFILYIWPRISLPLLCISSIILAIFAGTLSWLMIEQWTKDPFRRAHPSIAPGQA